jgi:YHS domain-containing protein
MTTRIGLVMLTAVAVLGAALLVGCPKSSGGGKTQTVPTPAPTSTEATPPPAETTAAQPPENIGNAKNAEGKYVCPVTGEPVTDFSKGNSVEYEGKAYFFCSSDCKPKFEADPAKYVKAAAAGEAPESSGPSEGEGKHAEGGKTETH